MSVLAIVQLEAYLHPSKRIQALIVSQAITIPRGRIDQQEYRFVLRPILDITEFSIVKLAIAESRHSSSYPLSHRRDINELINFQKLEFWLFRWRCGTVSIRMFYSPRVIPIPHFQLTLQFASRLTPRPQRTTSDLNSALILVETYNFTLKVKWHKFLLYANPSYNLYTFIEIIINRKTSW